MINRFEDAGIYIQDSQRITVEGCFIGTDATGTLDLGNHIGISIRAGSTFTQNITIGGDVAAERNVISGNDFLGINIFGGNDYFIRGNYIGTDRTGNAPLPNGSGIQVTAIITTIGGATTAERNVISGNKNRGIVLDSSQNTVQNNYIGIGADGFSSVGNGSTGIDIINSINLVNVGNHLIQDNVIANNRNSAISTFPANNRPIGQRFRLARDRHRPRRRWHHAKRCGRRRHGRQQFAKLSGADFGDRRRERNFRRRNFE